MYLLHHKVYATQHKVETLKDDICGYALLPTLPTLCNHGVVMSGTLEHSLLLIQC